MGITRDSFANLTLWAQNGCSAEKIVQLHPPTGNLTLHLFFCFLPTGFLFSVLWVQMLSRSVFVQAAFFLVVFPRDGSSRWLSEMALRDGSSRWLFEVASTSWLNLNPLPVKFYLSHILEGLLFPPSDPGGAPPS